MTPQQARLRREKGRWEVLARRPSGGSPEGSWLTLGGCRAQPPALRLWLALLGQEEGR